jgi:hypothetical protein
LTVSQLKAQPQVDRTQGCPVPGISFGALEEDGIAGLLVTRFGARLHWRVTKTRTAKRQGDRSREVHQAHPLLCLIGMAKARWEYRGCQVCGLQKSVYLCRSLPIFVGPVQQAISGWAL